LQSCYQTTALGKIANDEIRRGEQPQYSDDGEVLALKTVDLKNGLINYGNCLRVSRKFYEKYPKAQVKKSDVLISSTGYGSMGKVDVYDKDSLAIADNHISIVRLKEGYDPYFIAYFLRSSFGRIQFEQWWTGSSGQIELQPTDLGKFVVPDNSERGVPIQRQREIAHDISQKLDETHRLTSMAMATQQKARETFKATIYGL